MSEELNGFRLKYIMQAIMRMMEEMGLQGTTEYQNLVELSCPWRKEPDEVRKPKKHSKGS